MTIEEAIALCRSRQRGSAEKLTLEEWGEMADRLEKLRWRNVKDETPPAQGCVLISDDKGDVTMGTPEVLKPGNWYDLIMLENCKMSNRPYWLPVPTFEKGGENE